MLDVPDRRPVEDIVWSDRAYRQDFERAGLEVVEAHQPLGATNEVQPWVSELTVAPWTIYVLGPAGPAAAG